MTDERYYIKTPSGRERIKAASDSEAKRVFKQHWTAKANWYVSKGVRVLVKETRETLAAEDI